MKEPKKESFFKSKGFYVALYSCIGVVMILVGVMSYNNLTAVKDQQPIAEYTNELPPIDLGDLQATTANSTKSYLTPKDRADVTEKNATNETPATDNAAKRNSQNTVVPNATATTPPEQSKPAEQTKPAEQSKPAEQTKPAEQPKPAGTLQQPVTESTPATTTEPVKPEKKESKESKEKKETSVTPQEEPQELTDGFTPYSEDDKMAWPVFGVIAMEFSDNRAIYDETLEQYRTNDTVCIAAGVGTQVRAAADGIVKEVKTTRESGNTIVIDNGNEWVTTYSQLQDGMLVNEGDIVQKGQVLGGIAPPSIYSVLLGNHLGLKITCQDKPVNPKTIME